MASQRSFITTARSDPDEPAPAATAAELQARLRDLERENLQLRAILDADLRRSEARLASILASTDVAICKTRFFADKRWHVEFFSEACTSVFGYTPQELSADPGLWRSRLAPGEWERAIEPTTQLLFSGDEYTQEFLFLHRDGSTRRLSQRCRSMRDDADNCWVVTSSTTDITARWQAEHERDLSEARLRTIIEGADLFAWEFCVEDDRFTYLSFDRERLGFDHSQWSQPGFWKRTLHEDDRERTDVECLAQIAAGKPHRLHYRMVAADGRTVHISDFVCAPERHDGRTIVRGVAVDVTESVLTKHAYSEQAERLDLAVTATGLGLWDWNPATGSLVVSDLWASMLGYRVDELPATIAAWTDRVHPDDLPVALSALERSIREKTDYASEHRLRHRDGAYRWVLTRGRCIRRDHQGLATRFVGTYVDISARKAAEARETTHAATMSMIASGAPLGSILEFIVHAIETASPGALCSILLLDDSRQRLTSGAAPSLPAFYNSAIDGLSIGPSTGSCGSAAYSGKRVIVEDVQNHPFWTNFKDLAAQANLRSCWSEPISGAAGEVLGTFAIYHHEPRVPTPAETDLIEEAARFVAVAIERHRSTVAQQQSDRALLHAHERLQATNAALEEAQSVGAIGSWSFDLGTGLVEWSRQTFRLFGRDESLPPPSYADVLTDYAPADAARLDAAVRRTIDAGDPYSLVLKTSARYPDVRYVRGEGRAKRDATGCVVALFGTVMDVTAEVERTDELRIAQQRAEEGSRAKSEFLANMSHEIRNPMTAILGFAEVLAIEAASDGAPPARLDAIDTIKRSGKHLISIINDILDVSKIEAGQMTAESIPTRPAGIVNEVVSLLRIKALEKGLDLAAACDATVPDSVLSDPLRLRQILVNLVDNAIKFTNAGGVRIAVRTAPDDPAASRLLFEISDSGIGLNPQQIERLFVAFEQADTSMTRRFGGTGLGLRISKGLAAILGGDITVSSEPGRGSAFTLSLPCRAASTLGAPEAIPSSTAPDVPLNGIRILLAEDGADNQRLIAIILRNAGAEVAIVNNGQEAVEALTIDGTLTGPLIEPPPVGILLTDMRMPEMDGYAAARLLRNKGCTLPIIALTAHAISGGEARCLAAGCDAYASKPIDAAKLIELCRNAARGTLPWIRTGRVGSAPLGE